MVKLSILIPTLPEPDSQNYLKRIRSILQPQLEIQPEAELIIHDAPRSMPTGTKRNELIARANGEYIVQIDCDDTVPIYYISELLKAIKHNPDVITFKGYMITDGANRRNFTIKLESDYTEKDGHYYRWPNHLACYKKSLIEHIKFQPIWIQEDYQWSLAVKKEGLLKHEIHLDQDMYCYDFKTKKQQSVQTRRSMR